MDIPVVLNQTGAEHSIFKGIFCRDNVKIGKSTLICIVLDSEIITLVKVVVHQKIF